MGSQQLNVIQINNVILSNNKIGSSSVEKRIIFFFITVSTASGGI